MMTWHYVVCRTLGYAYHTPLLDFLVLLSADDTTAEEAGEVSRHRNIYMSEQ